MNDVEAAVSQRSDDAAIAPVFISHARADRKVADGICSALESRGLPCWIATRDVPPGENFGEAISQVIHSARVMVLVFSVDANNSNEIKKEVVLAGRRGIPVIPVRVDDIEPSGAFEYELVTRQWIDLFIGWDQAIDRLVRQIKQVSSLPCGANVAPGPASRVSTAPPPSTDTERTVLSHPSRRVLTLRRLILACLILAVIGTGIALWRNSGTLGNGEIHTQQSAALPISPAKPVPPEPAPTEQLAKVQAAPPPAQQLALRPDQSRQPELPASPTIEQVAHDFLGTFLANWSSSNTLALKYLASVYAPEVNNYGQTLSFAAVMDVKRKYLERWPERVYTVRAPTIVVECDHSASICTVSGVVDWDCRSPARGARSTGVSNMTMRLAVANGSVKVLAETGDVISRQASQLP